MGPRCRGRPSPPSPTRSSRVWSTGRTRPLDPVYPVIFIDAIHVKIRDGQVANRPLYVALAVTCEGRRDILGLRAGDGGEGVKYWLHAALFTCCATVSAMRVASTGTRSPRPSSWSTPRGPGQPRASGSRSSPSVKLRRQPRGQGCAAAGGVSTGQAFLISSNTAPNSGSSASPSRSTASKWWPSGWSTTLHASPRVDQIRANSACWR